MNRQSTVLCRDCGGALDRGSQGCGIYILQTGVGIISCVGGNRQRAGAVPIYRGHGKPGCVLIGSLQIILRVQSFYGNGDVFTVPI